MFENIPYERLHVGIRQPVEHFSPFPPACDEVLIQEESQALRSGGHLRVSELRDLRDLALSGQEQLDRSQPEISVRTKGSTRIYTSTGLAG